MTSVTRTLGGRVVLALVGALLALPLSGCIFGYTGRVLFGPAGNSYDLGLLKLESDEAAQYRAAAKPLQTANPCVPQPGQSSNDPAIFTGTSTVNILDESHDTWIPAMFGDVGALSDAAKAVVRDQGIGITAIGCVISLSSGPTPTTKAEQIIGTTQGVLGVDPLNSWFWVYAGLEQSHVQYLLAGFNDFFVAVSPGTGGPLWSCNTQTHACTDASAGLSTSVTQVNTLAMSPGSLGVPLAGTNAGAWRWQTGVWTETAGLSGVSVTDIGVGNGNPIWYGSADGLWVSMNGGTSAARVSSLPRESVTALAAAGSDVDVNFATSGLRSSSDSGSTFIPHAGPPGSSTIFGLAEYKNGLIALTDIGVFRTMDRMTWTPFSTGLFGGRVNQFAVGANGPVAATDGGLFSSKDGGAWTPRFYGAWSVVLAQAQNVFAMGASATRSVDGGQTFVPSVTGLPQGQGPPSGAASNDATFFVTFSSSGLYKSLDFGATWTYVPIGSASTFPATAVAANGSLVVVGGSSGQVAGSTDGGITFVPWTATGSAAVLSLTVQGSDVFAGLAGNGVEKTSDSGMTWTQAGDDLGSTSVLSLAGTGSPASFARHAEAASGTTRFAGMAGDPTLFAGTSGGLYMSTDAGGSWSLASKGLFGTAVKALYAAADRLYVGTNGLGGQEILLPLSVTRIVPVVVDVTSGAAHYTSELSLTNRGSTPVSVSLTYTASLGTGSGTVDENLGAGQQLVIPDVIAYLRNKGLALTGSQAGTLVLTFLGAEAPDVVAATARTTALTAAPQPVGNAGLAYSAVSPGIGTTGRLIVYGLRSNATDRSNLAVFNTTTDPVTVKVTAYSGDGTGQSVVIAASETLGPYGWYQYNGILGTAGFANGYVAVERVSAAGAFSAYGVVNNNGTNDGSFLLPHVEGGLLPYLNVPVLVETSTFLSELVLANSGSTIAHLTLTYMESLDAAGGGGSVAVTLAPGTQQIIPNAIAYLRSHGASIGPPGRNYAGALHIVEYGAAIDDIYAGARTASPSPGGGQFGLFTPAFYPGTEGAGSAYIYGLRADANNRSNVAVVNTGPAGAGSVTLRLQAYDGDAGGVAAGDPTDLVVAPGAWKQVDGFLGSKGVANGWVKVTLISGSAPWIAYGVVNDGGAPGQRTSDGAYVPMSR